MLLILGLGALRMKTANNKTVKRPAKQRSGIGRALLSTLALIVVFVVSFFVIASIASPKKLTRTNHIDQMYSVVDSYGGTYFGPLSDMSYTGNGEFQYLSGGYYEGEFSNSQREGTGTFHWTNGDSYVGSWSGDQMVTGTYTFSNGNYYTGDFSNNRYSSGSFYLSKSTLVQDLRSFSALYSEGKVLSITFETESGFCFSGQVNGSAEITYENGDTYSGEVKNGIRDGTGKYSWVDEDGKTIATYEGTWKDDIMNGSGSYHYTSDEYPYIKGSFSDGKPEGTAIYYKESDNTFDTVWENGNCISVTES